MSKEVLILVDALAREKNVEREIVFQSLESALASATKKRFSIDSDIVVRIDRANGEYDAFRRWKVVEDEEYTNDEYDKLATWRKEYMEKNKPLIEKYKSLFDKWYKKHKDLLSKREIYGKLEWQVGKIKPNDSIFNYFIQIRQSGIRVRKAEYFPTLVAISQIPIYGKEKRYITPRECARLQSFPDSYKIHPNDKKSYKHFGNSVNVDNVNNVISSTFKHYGYL